MSFVALLLFVGKKIGNTAGWLVWIAGDRWKLFVLGAWQWWRGSTAARPTVSVWGDRQLPIVFAHAVDIQWGSGGGNTHSGYLDVGLYIDSLTLVMFCMITLDRDVRARLFHRVHAR